LEIKKLNPILSAQFHKKATDSTRQTHWQLLHFLQAQLQPRVLSLSVH